MLLQDLCHQNFAGKKCVTKINSFSIIQEIFISCNIFANAFLISISKYLNWILDVAWHSILQLFCEKKKSLLHKNLQFWIPLFVSPLNNCLLKSRKLEILKCESLKSCVSKKTNSVFCSDYCGTLPMRKSFMPKIVYSCRHHCWNIM